MQSVAYETPVRYAAAVAAVFVALSLTLLVAWLLPSVDPTPVVLFAGGVLVSAWYGGVGPGLLASFLAAGSIQFFISAALHFDVRTG